MQHVHHQLDGDWLRSRGLCWRRMAPKRLQLDKILSETSLELNADQLIEMSSQLQIAISSKIVNNGLGPALWTWLVKFLKMPEPSISNALIHFICLGVKFLSLNIKKLAVSKKVMLKLFVNILQKTPQHIDVEHFYEMIEEVERFIKNSDLLRDDFDCVLNFCCLRINFQGNIDWSLVKSLFSSSTIESREDKLKILISFMRKYCNRVNSPANTKIIEFFCGIKSFCSPTFFEQKVIDKLAPFMTAAKDFKELSIQFGKEHSWRIILNCSDICDIEKLPPFYQLAISVNAFLAGKIDEIQMSPIGNWGHMTGDYLNEWLERTINQLVNQNHKIDQVMEALLILLPLMSNAENSIVSLIKIVFAADGLEHCKHLIELLEGNEIKSKMLASISGSLCAKMREKDALWFMRKFIDLSCNCLSVKLMLAYASVFSKHQDQHYQIQAHLRAIKMASTAEPESLSLAVESFSLKSFTDFSWSYFPKDIVEITMPLLLKIPRVTPLILSLLKETSDHQIVLWKHRYYLLHYRDAPVEILLEESRRFLHVDDRFNYFMDIWKFCLGLEPKDGVLHSLHRGEFVYDCIIYREMISRIKEAQAQGKRFEALRDAHQCLKHLENVVKLVGKDSRDFISDSKITFATVKTLCLMKRLYSELGAIKPVKAYLKQALDISKSMWPQAQRMWIGLIRELAIVDSFASGAKSVDLEYQDNEIVWTECDISINTGSIEIDRPFLYFAFEEHIEWRRLTWEAYNLKSPSEFKALTCSIVKSRKVEIEFALGLLALASALPFERLAQFERFRVDGIDEVPIISLENWPDFVKAYGRQHPDFSVVSLTLDCEKTNLIMANYSTRRILVTPAKSHAVVVEKIEEILVENKSILFSQADDTTDAHYKRTWWKSRQKLDSEISALATKVDSEWLSLFKILFPCNHDQATIERMEDQIKLQFPDLRENLAEVFLQFGTFPKATALDSLLNLVDSPSRPIRNRTKAIRSLRRCYEAVFPELECTVFLDEPEIQTNLPETLLLVVDKELHQIPWEATSTMRQFRSIYRQASFWHLNKTYKKLENESVSYILNPGGDLKQTEAFFMERLDGSWRGIVGRPPAQEEFLLSLSESKLFLYFGHGGGDKYVSGSKIRGLADTGRIAPSFLIGCSSGKMKINGPYCADGTFLNYLYAGCPTVLVNLWDVTDKDIDKFTDTMFEFMGIYGEQDPKLDLGEAVSKSRNACFMRNLNGAAPVVYGLPFSWNKSF